MMELGWNTNVSDLCRDGFIVFYCQILGTEGSEGRTYRGGMSCCKNFVLEFASSVLFVSITEDYASRANIKQPREGEVEAERESGGTRWKLNEQVVDATHALRAHDLYLPTPPRPESRQETFKLLIVQITTGSQCVRDSVGQ